MNTRSVVGVILVGCVAITAVCIRATSRQCEGVPLCEKLPSLNKHSFATNENLAKGPSVCSDTVPSEAPQQLSVENTSHTGESSDEGSDSRNNLEELIRLCREPAGEQFVIRWSKVKAVDFRDIDGMTPLCQAVISDRFEIIEYLIDHGAKVDFSTVDGRTPLHYAIEKNSPVMARYLLRAGANYLLASNAGETVVDVAKRRGLYPRDAEAGDFPKFVQAQIVRATNQCFKKTEALANHARDLIKLRAQLIAEHREDQRRLAAELGIYGTTTRTRERYLYTETEVTHPIPPREFAEDLPLPFPKEEVESALQSAAYTVLLAELAYGKDDSNYSRVRNGVERMIAELR